MKIDKYGKMLHRTINAAHQTVWMWGTHKKSFAGLQQRSRKALFPSSQENWTGGPPMPSSPVLPSSRSCQHYPTCATEIVFRRSPHSLRTTS